MKSTIKIILAVLVSVPLVAGANPDEKQPGSATARLMAMQSSGEAASTQEQNLSGKARSEIYQRYVKSFSQPIPDTFIDDSFKSE